MIAREPEGAGWARTHPYRLLFPFGVLLSWAGVAHWLLHATGYLAEYRPVFHVIVQIQGFLTCLAVGFLLTMIPRRTASAPPGRALLALAVLAPAVTTVAAWFGRFALAQAAWLTLVVALLGFAGRRFLGGAGAGRRPPPGFVWVPAALLMGIAGSLLFVLTPAGAGGESLLHALGRGLLLQGMFTGLVLGVGSLALPLMTRGEAPADLAPGLGGVVAVALHAAAAAVLAASFWVQAALSLSAGMLLRAAVVTAVYLLAHHLYRLPTRPGWNPRLIWLAAWMVPLGTLLGGLYPAEFRAGLHVTFIAGFALLALSVGAHVTLAHGERMDVALGRPWEVPTLGALLLAATAFRALMEVDPDRYFTWMALASACFLAGTLAWTLLITRPSPEA